MSFEKLKIKGVFSEEYPGGRIDSFMVALPDESPHHSHIIPLFLDLGFSKEVVLDKLDVVLNEIDYLFVYGNPRIKAHLIVDESGLCIILDTSIPKEEIVGIFEKYFQFLGEE